MATLTSTPPTPCVRDTRRAVRDSLIVTVGGQLERALGVVTALALRWSLDPARMGVYAGLRLFLDQTNRTSLGVGLGAVQRIPILRASGREADAQRLADVAYTTNTLTCLAYALGLAAWAWLLAPARTGDPLAGEWTWGLLAVAVLVVLKRYESFAIAVLRARQDFRLTTELEVIAALMLGVATLVGLGLAGFWGLLAALGATMALKIAWLHARCALRFRWVWDLGTALRLMRIGLPILANTAAFGAVVCLDRVIILRCLPDGATALGLYSVALLGTNWALDLAGRIATVMYTYFQTTLGRTGDLVEVAHQAMRTTAAQVPLLAFGSAGVYLLGPMILGLVLPRYAEGLPALRPLVPGMTLLGLAWPARQLLIAVGRPYRLFLATLAGLAVAAVAATLGAQRSGIVGVAWGMTIGYASVYVLTSGSAFVSILGWRAWLDHQARVAGSLSWFAAGAVIAAHAPLAGSDWRSLPLRCLVLIAWTGPVLWHWGRRHEWGGLVGSARVRQPETIL